MKYYTIKPLLNISDYKNPSIYILFEDIEKIENKIKKIIAQNDKNSKLSTTINFKYLEIIKNIKDNFAGVKKICRKDFILSLHNILLNKDLHYQKETHQIAHDNLFNPVDNNSNPANTAYYDIAFYHQLSGKNPKAHHSHEIFEKWDEGLPDVIKKKYGEFINASNELSNKGKYYKLKEYVDSINTLTNNKIEKRKATSTFYARCEEYNDSILIGNMQIDDKGNGSNWDDEVTGAIMLKKNNIYSAIIQESIKHAIMAGKNKILFQAGYAAELAQWGDNENFKEKTLITDENINKYKEIYKQRVENFKNINPGDPVDNEGGYIAIHKTSSKIFIAKDIECYLLPCIYEITAQNKYFNESLTAEIIENDLRKNIEINLNEHVIKKKKSTNKSRRYRGMSYNTSEDCTKGTIYNDLYTSDISIPLHTNVVNDFNSYDAEFIKTATAHIYLYNDLKYNLIKGNANEVLYYINKIFSYVVDVDFEKDKLEKINSIKEIIKKTRIKIKNLESHCYFEAFKEIEAFLIKFNYHQLLINKFSTIEEIKHSTDKCNNKRFVINDLCEKIIDLGEAPEVGKFININYKKELEHEENTVHKIGREKMYRWYECTIPSILKQLKIDYKKTIIYKNRENNFHDDLENDDGDTLDDIIRDRQDALREHMAIHGIEERIPPMRGFRRNNYNIPTPEGLGVELEIPKEKNAILPEKKTTIAYAWEITTPVEDLKNKSFIVF